MHWFRGCGSEGSVPLVMFGNHSSIHFRLVGNNCNSKGVKIIPSHVPCLSEDLMWLCKDEYNRTRKQLLGCCSGTLSSSLFAWTFAIAQNGVSIQLPLASHSRCSNMAGVCLVSCRLNMPGQDPPFHHSQREMGNLDFCRAG